MLGTRARTADKTDVVLACPHGARGWLETGTECLVRVLQGVQRGQAAVRSGRGRQTEGEEGECSRQKEQHVLKPQGKRQNILFMELGGGQRPEHRSRSTGGEAGEGKRCRGLLRPHYGLRHHPGTTGQPLSEIYEEPERAEGMDQQMDRQMRAETLIRKMRNEAGKVVSQQDG